MVPPDPYILVKGLSGICEKLLPTMREASFRTSMFFDVEVKTDAGPGPH